MKYYILLISVFIFFMFSSCKKDEDPDLAFSNLKLQTTAQGWAIQKDTFALVDCDNVVQVKRYAKPDLFFPCMGNPLFFPQLHDDWFYSNTKDTVVWFASNSSQTYNYAYVVNLNNAFSLQYIGRHKVRAESYPFALLNNYLLQNTDGDMLTISRIEQQDKTDPGSIENFPKVSVTQLPELREMKAAAMYKNYLYVGGTGGSKIYVLDVTKMTKPVIVGQIMVQMNVGMLIHNNYLYTFGNQEFTIHDLSDPAHPTPIKRYDAPFGERAFAIKGNYLYLGHNNLSIYDISDPKKLKLVKRIETAPYEIQRFYLWQDYLYAFSLNMDEFYRGHYVLLFTGNSN